MVICLACMGCNLSLQGRCELLAWMSKGSGVTFRNSSLPFLIMGDRGLSSSHPVHERNLRESKPIESLRSRAVEELHFNRVNGLSSPGRQAATVCLGCNSTGKRKASARIGHMR